ncbi:lysozyme inhibitor LprI family protein [Roseobacter sp. CCS2]|uniref:lysozyme inhibitor LprI family protein n=1 Tax=Roseobacter sp. CCS2 TaxID=391593 RepID=UPI0000F3FDC7|nr:lysozyme inhibitor LprI family protein [Roseobacter sp. CCS2]EBA10721.1 hypothetical protein RCCS2_02975 [Roseobacter sp. CCS2]
MKKLLFFCAMFLSVGTMVSAGCADYEDNSLPNTPAPQYRICYDDVCDETTLSFVCSNINGTQKGFANGWATYYTTAQSGAESFRVTWHGRTIDADKHSRLTIEEIGQLHTPVATNSSDALASCLAAADNAVGCLGVVGDIEVSENGCIRGQDPTDCWAAEAAAWDAQLAIEMSSALAAVTDLVGQDFANDLQASQNNWRNTRASDCKVYLPLVFAQDGGAALCRAEYAAKRIDFLRDVVIRSEFQG